MAPSVTGRQVTEAILGQCLRLAQNQSRGSSTCFRLIKR